MFKRYKRKEVDELKPYVVGMEEEMHEVSLSIEDMRNGSPKEGDMIARNPKNYNDKWLVSKQYFEDNFEDAITSSNKN